jgi:hypothetical protein
MRAILVERRRVGQLVRLLDDVDVEVERAERREDLVVEVGDGHGPHRDGPDGALARRHDDAMVDEVEVDLEAPGTVRDRRRRETARGHVERHVPRVVDPRRPGEPDLPDDLRPAVERRVRILPVGQREDRPGVSVGCHTHLQPRV